MVWTVIKITAYLQLKTIKNVNNHMSTSINEMGEIKYIFSYKLSHSWAVPQPKAVQISSVMQSWLEKLYYTP